MSGAKGLDSSASLGMTIWGDGGWRGDDGWGMVPGGGITVVVVAAPVPWVPAYAGTTARGEGVSRPTTSTPLPQVLRRGLLRTALPSQFAGGANTLPRSREA